MEETKLTLFADERVVYMENSRESNGQTVRFSERYICLIQGKKLIQFLNCNKNQLENTIENIPIHKPLVL